MATIGEWWMWGCFFIFIACMIAVDLFLFGGRKAHRVSTTEALIWTLVWFSLALLFNGLLWWYLAQTLSVSLATEKALEFLSGYLIEKSLSIDNIFVILLIFNYFAIPAEYQRRVLLYGILGAVVLRLCFILMGLWIVNTFHWVLYLFGLFLLLTGIKMLWITDEQPNLASNPLLLWMRRHLRITDTLHKEQFFVRYKKLLYVTPLFLVLILVEASDIIFAVDSIPAVFAITNDPFIVFTSNIFAILGLRALYFLLADMDHRFYLLKYGLALILIFIGLKMLVAYWFKIPIFIALGFVVVVLIASIGISLYFNKQRQSP